MPTPLEKPLKREIVVDGETYVVTLASETLKVVRKGKRNGIEYRWSEMLSGEAGLAVALQASLTQGK